MVRYFHNISPKRQTEAYYATPNSNRTDKTSPLQRQQPCFRMTQFHLAVWSCSSSTSHNIAGSDNPISFSSTIPSDMGSQQHFSNISAANTACQGGSSAKGRMIQRTALNPASCSELTLYYSCTSFSKSRVH